MGRKQNKRYQNWKEKCKIVFADDIIFVLCRKSSRFHQKLLELTSSAKLQATKSSYRNQLHFYTVTMKHLKRYFFSSFWDSKYICCPTDVWSTVLFSFNNFSSPFFRLNNFYWCIFKFSFLCLLFKFTVETI